MGRMIDADKLIKNIKQEHDKTIIIPIERLFGIIDTQPIAFDVDKIVEQLVKTSKREDISYMDWLRLDEAIDIVKEGGKE